MRVAVSYLPGLHCTFGTQPVAYDCWMPRLVVFPEPVREVIDSRTGRLRHSFGHQAV
jgi:hypothetical protein